MAVFCSMSKLVLVSQSNVSLPLLLPFLMATLSCQWVTPHLWLPAVCFCTLGIIHITQVHWKKIQVCVIFFVEALLNDGGLCMQHFLSACGDESGKHTRVHPGFVGSVWISVSLLLRWAVNGQEHDVLWIIPVSLIHYPNGPLIIIR